MLSEFDAGSGFDLATKQVKKAEFTKHPYSKKRLRVLDAFEPNHFDVEVLPDGSTVEKLPDLPVTDEIAQQHGWVVCPQCRSVKIEKLMIVESDVQNGPPYQVVCCGSCAQQSWFVIMG